MIHKGAIAILTTMIAGLLAWGGTSIQENNNRIIVLETKEETYRQLLKEVRDDVKVILQKVE